MNLTLAALCIGFILDLCIGDPYFLYHPVRLIGHLITVTEKILRRVFPNKEKAERISGIILVVVVLFVSSSIPFGILLVAGKIHPVLRLIIESIFCYQLLATKALKDESMKVYFELKKGDIKGARMAVSMIVGRDTDSLTEEGIAKAAVETVAENTSDGIIAPMLFMAIGGAPLGFFYKAVNTMDSMVGYKNERYLHFGRAAAKLDDILNYIPARISAYLMIMASKFLGLDAKNAYKIFKRDRYNHASPNSAQTESVCAGALNIQLAGDAYYFGKLYKKKYIGDPNRSITYEDIKLANRLLYGAAILGLLCIVLIYAVFVVCNL